MARGHLDTTTPFTLAEIRERLADLADRKAAPWPRDRIALREAVALLELLELQRKG